MISKVKCVTSNLNNLENLKKSLEIFKFKILCCNFATSNVLFGKKKKKKKKKKCWFWKRDKSDEIELIKPRPILEPACKIGMIIGSKGFGFVAANKLLSKGARKVIIADRKNSSGDRAVQRLCNTYGRDRATFLQCDTKDPVLLEATFSEVICRYKSIHVLFNDLDENQNLLSNTSICGKSDDNWSATRRLSMIGLKYMGTENGGPGGIIVNCASILGFMDWPQNPSPIYCKKEPVIEVTREIAEENSFEKNGVRFVTICPTNRPFEKICLPDFPEAKRSNECPEECIPPKKISVGLALTHVMAWAHSGSTWLVPPFSSLYELPKLIHFPKNPDELVDPEIYKKKNCPVALESYCAKILEEKEPFDPNSSCGLTNSEPKRKGFFSRKKK